MARYRKRSSAGKIFLVFLLLITMCATATSLAMGIKNNGWFEKDDTQTEEQAEVGYSENNYIG